MLASGSSVQYPVQQITTTNEHVTNNNNEVRNEITVNVTAPVGADAPEIGRVVRDELGKVLRETGINQKETE
jgi:hypothetical protein